MPAGKRGPHAAASSALGYAYQFRYALLEALRRIPGVDPISIRIETLDDVVFETGDSSLEVFQTKHHVQSQANLTNASPDLWKTLGNWIEGQSDGTIPRDTRFFLVTTAVCADGSAAAYLRADKDRDEAKALEHLSATAAISSTSTNAAAYRSFIALKSTDRENLLGSVTIVDGSPSIDDLDKQLRQAVFYATERRFLDSFLNRLEAWWYDRVLKHLRDSSASPILGEELEAEENRLREQFKDDNLPIDPDIMRAAVDASGYLGQTFVRQLNLIGVNENRIVHAIRAYYRAFEHRSRWVREKLIYVGDLERYEAQLVEEWDLQFQQMRDELGTAAAEEAMTGAAQALYRWVESGAHLPIRPAVTEPAIARGSYQMLADDLRVGWHPEFRQRLQAVVLGVVPNP